MVAELGIVSHLKITQNKSVALISLEPRPCDPGNSTKLKSFRCNRAININRRRAHYVRRRLATTVDMTVWKFSPFGLKSPSVWSNSVTFVFSPDRMACAVIPETL